MAPRDNYTIQADRVLSAERGSRSYSSMSFNGIYPRSMDCSNPKTDYFAGDVEDDDLTVSTIIIKLKKNPTLQAQGGLSNYCLS